jgi:Recombinational DNA repair protein (RecE pathway)
MSNQIQIKIEELNALPATKIVEHTDVEAKFIQMYNNIWGAQSGMQIYAKEVFNFQKVLRENPAVADCSKMSLYGCFLDMAVNGLSLDPTGRPHCYLIPRSVKTGHKDQKGKDIYEKRASVSITGYGELTMRMRAGQIKYADNPVIVYEGDTFSVDLDRGIKRINYSAAIPRTSTRVIGAFIRIVRADGSEDYQWLLEGDIQRLKGFSEKNNGYWKDGQYVNGAANKLYSSNGGQIDPGFLENKMIKHAFDAYPKVRIGKFTQFDADLEQEQEVDYGITDIEAEEIPSEQQAIENHTQCGFGPNETPTPELEGITVNTSEEDTSAGF